MKHSHRAQKDCLNRLFHHYRMLNHLSDGGSLTPKQHAFVQRMEQTVSRLPEMERAIISRRYLPADADYIRDGEVYKALRISSGTYHQRRYRAFEKVAAAFGLYQPENKNEKDDEHE